MSKELKVLVLDPLPETALAVFRNSNYKVDFADGELSEAALCRKVEDYNIICVKDKRPETYLTDEVIKSAHRLLAIGVFSQYTSSVDLSTAQNLGIPVFSSPYGHSQAVAELCISFIILLARQVGDRSMEVHSGEWNKVSANCYEIRGKTLGVLGYGHVGVALGILAESIGMKVVFYDIATVLPHGRNESVSSLDAICAASDFLSIHVTATKDNACLIGREQIARMKKGSYIINAGYAEALDLDAVADAIKSKHLGGVAVDVFPNPPEGKVFTSPLMGLRNVIMTPNIGDGTAQAVERVGEEVAQCLARFVTEGSTVGSVNFPSINGWPVRPGCRRIANVHQNVRGVLREIDAVLSAYNVGKQVLETSAKVGYLIADIETEGKEVTTEIVSQLAVLSSSIRTRIL